MRKHSGQSKTKHQSRIKPGTHQADADTDADADELVATKADCVVGSCRQRLGQSCPASKLPWQTKPTLDTRRPSSMSVLRLRKKKCLSVPAGGSSLLHWFASWTANQMDANSTCRIGWKKADEDQLQPTVRNTLRKLSRPTNKNCPMAYRRLGVFRV